MSTHSYVGVAAVLADDGNSRSGRHDPDQPGKVRLRYVHSNGYFHYMIPALRQIRSGAAAGDTKRLVALLMEHDWDYLDPDTTDGSSSSPFAGEQLIPGVGMTLAVTNGDGQVLPPEPVTGVALTPPAPSTPHGSTCSIPPPTRSPCIPAAATPSTPSRSRHEPPSRGRPPPGSAARWAAAAVDRRPPPSGRAMAHQVGGDRR